ncbi:MAG: BTAD domain-containing putative transcriptional regulator [Chloroflexia bacterium]
MLTIRLFGGLAMERDGQPMPAPTPKKAARLLTYLMVAHERAHPRSLLAGLFWGEKDESRARRYLSDALWRIRSLLEPRDSTVSGVALLLFEGDTVRLNPDAELDLDVRRFESLARELGDVDAQVRAAELYRGDLLVGYYDDWVLIERERLRRIYLGCLLRTIAAYKTAGAWEEAAATAARLVAADPYQEEAVRELMRLYYRLGRRDRALQQFVSLKALLAEEMGVEPEPETLALHNMMQAGQALTGRDAEPARQAVSALSALGGNTTRLPVVGREPEQARLAGWLAAPRPNPAMLALVGEAGVGKTRLAHDTAEEAYRSGMFVLWGGYHQFSAPLPYAGLVEALRVGLRLGGVPTLEPIWLSEVSRLMPELSEMHPGLPPPVSLPPDQERIRLWEALTRYLLAMAAVGPHLLVLEDLQWVDPATLDLLQYALPRLRSTGASLRLLATLRSEEMDDPPHLTPALLNLEAEGILGYMRVDPLSPEAMQAFVQEALGLSAPAPLFSRHLWEETEGNAFFALETIRFWTEQGVLTRRSDGSWHTPSVNYSEELPTPASVRRVLEQRLARLSAAARSVIEVGAVLGRRVPAGILGMASGATAESVLGPAEELIRRQLWVEDAESDGYQFTHQKVLEAAYTGISGPRRRHLHRLAATALEAEQLADVASLAHHWLAAGDGTRALPHLQAAAKRAAAAFANDEALAFYNQALGVIGEEVEAAGMSDEALDRAYDLLAERGGLNSLIGQMERAGTDLDRLVRLARDAGKPDRMADAFVRRASHYIAQSRYGEALADLDEALAGARSEGLPTARIFTELAAIYLQRGDLPAAIEAAEQGLPACREADDRVSEIRLLNMLGAAYGLRGGAERATAVLGQALEKVRQVPNSLHLEARVLNNLSMFVSSPQASYDLFCRALEISEQAGMLESQATIHHNLAEICYRFGLYTDALKHLRRSEEFSRALKSELGLSMLLITRGQVHAMLGDPASARADLLEAVRSLEALGVRHTTMTALVSLGDFLLDQGEHAAGLAYIERSYKLWEELGKPEAAGNAALFAAQKARAYLGLRRSGAARQAVVVALTSLEEARAAGGSWADPFVEILAHCYSVLDGIGRRQEADAALEEGYRLMMKIADFCGPKLRTGYLENVHECRVLRAAWLAQRAAARTHAPPPDMPYMSPPIRPPIHEHQRGVQAHTPPPDMPYMSPRGATYTGRRRAELSVMLRDAAESGHALDAEELATTFGVSLRTIRRDLAALRSANYEF